MIKRVWESVGLVPHLYTKGLGSVKGTNGWCVVC
jgi:hypothetical protein